MTKLERVYFFLFWFIQKFMKGELYFKVNDQNKNNVEMYICGALNCTDISSKELSKAHQITGCFYMVIDCLLLKENTILSKRKKEIKNFLNKIK